MTKNLRKTFIMLLACLMAAAALFAVAFGLPRTASAFTGDRQFSIVGASVRTVDESSGLRFTANFNQTVYDEVFDENGENKEGKKLGILVVPADYATAAENAESYGAAKYYEYFRDVKGKYKNYIFDAESVKKDGDVYVANAALVNILLENMDLDFVAIGYVATTTEAESGTVTTYEYTAKSAAKNVAAVVAETLSDAQVDYTEEPENLAVLQELEAKAIYDNAGVTFDDQTQKYVYKGTSYDNYSDIILDKGDLGEIELSAGSKSYATATFGLNAKYARTVSVKLGTADVSATAEDGNVNLTGLKIGELNSDTGSYVYTPYGEQTLVFDFGNIKFSANVLSVSDIITTKEEMLDFIDAAKRVELVAGGSGNVSTYSGYYKLGADIDMGGDAVSNTLPLTGANAYYNAPNAGFLGTFDGAGYAIYNFAVNTPTGLFAGLNQGAVLKNVSLLGVKIKTVGGKSGGTLGQSVYNATIENVRISVEAVSGKYTGAIARRVRGNDTILKNVIIDYVSSLTADEDATSSIFFEVSEKPKATNVLVIKDANKPLNSAYPTQVVSGIDTTTWDALDYSGVDTSVFDADTHALPVLKGDGLVVPYTVDYYKGRMAQNWWENQESAILFGKIGETVSAEAKTFTYTQTTPLAALSTSSATLAKDTATALKVYYESTYDNVNVVDDDGEATGVIFNHYNDNVNFVTEYKGTVGGQENAYYVSSNDEWNGRIQLLDPTKATVGTNHGWGKDAVDVINNNGYKTLKFKIYYTHTVGSGYNIYGTKNYVNGEREVINICDGNYVTGNNTELAYITMNGTRVNRAAKPVAEQWYEVTIDLKDIAAVNNNFYISHSKNISGYYIADVKFSKDDYPISYDSINVLNNSGEDTHIDFQFRDSLDLAGYFDGKHSMNNIGTYEGKDNVYKLVADGSWKSRYAFNQCQDNAVRQNDATAGKLATTTMSGYKTISFDIYLAEGVTTLNFAADGGNAIVSFVDATKPLSGFDTIVNVVDADGNTVTATLEAGQWYKVVIDITGDKTTDQNKYYLLLNGTAYIANLTLSNVAFA